MLDFLAFQSEVAEFNVFKYAPAGNGRGVVAVQFARRFRLGELDAEAVRQLRQRTVNEMAGFDVSPARAAFALDPSSAQDGRVHLPVKTAWRAVEKA